MAAQLNKKALEAGDLTLAARRRNQDTLNVGLDVSSDNVRSETAVLQNKIRLLKLLVVELQLGLESLSEVQTPDVERGIDFYEAVTRFEIELIKQALRLTNGHQTMAARLLNLNATTLGAKIKHYRIQLGHPAFFK